MITNIQNITVQRTEMSNLSYTHTHTHTIHRHLFQESSERAGRARHALSLTVDRSLASTKQHGTPRATHQHIETRHRAHCTPATRTLAIPAATCVATVARRAMRRSHSTL